MKEIALRYPGINLKAEHSHIMSGEEKLVEQMISEMLPGN